MPLIKVNKLFRYALGGNHIVEFCEGIHSVKDEIARCAIDELKVAEVSKAKKATEKSITQDIHGNDLSAFGVAVCDVADVAESGDKTDVENEPDNKENVEKQTD